MKISALGVEEQRVNVIVDFADPAEAARLGDGYRVEVRIVLWKDDDVLKVPVGGSFVRAKAGRCSSSTKVEYAGRPCSSVSATRTMDKSPAGSRPAPQSCSTRPIR